MCSCPALLAQVAAFRSEVNTADAKAEAARQIEAARQQQEVVKEQAMQRVIEAKTLLEYEVCMLLKFLIICVWDVL